MCCNSNIASFTAVTCVSKGMCPTLLFSENSFLVAANLGRIITTVAFIFSMSLNL